MTEISVRNRMRNLRARAKSLGLTVTKRADVVTIFDSAGLPMMSGNVDHAEVWIADRYVRRAPGPDALEVPSAWRPWIEVFVAEQNAAKRQQSTIHTRVLCLARFARAHPGSTPLAVTRDELIAYMGQSDWTPRTAHSVRSTLRLFFRMLYELEHRRDNPARTLPAISIPRAMPRPCPDHVVRQAFASVTDARVGLAIRIAVETGMRRAEIARIRPTDVFGQPGNFWVHITAREDINAQCQFRINWPARFSR